MGMHSHLLAGMAICRFQLVSVCDRTYHLVGDSTVPNVFCGNSFRWVSLTKSAPHPPPPPPPPDPSSPAPMNTLLFIYELFRHPRIRFLYKRNHTAAALFQNVNFNKTAEFSVVQTKGLCVASLFFFFDPFFWAASLLLSYLHDGSRFCISDPPTPAQCAIQKTEVLNSVFSNDNLVKEKKND